jgi:hypothetical protein
MKSKTTNAPKCMNVYYKHREYPTCFGHTYGNLQGSLFRRIGTSKYYRIFLTNAEIQNIKF